MSEGLVAIEAAAKALRAARDTLADRANFLNDQLETAKKASLRGLKNSVAQVAEAQANLLAAIDQTPQLFIKPKSMVLHGLQLGYRKGTGSMDWDDDAQVIKLIRKHFPEQAELLVKTTEKPLKSAMGNLSVSDLKKVGVTVEDTGDVSFAKDTTAVVDKLIKALLKGAEDEVDA